VISQKEITPPTLSPILPFVADPVMGLFPFFPSHGEVVTTNELLLFSLALRVIL